MKSGIKLPPRRLARYWAGAGVAVVIVLFSVAAVAFVAPWMTPPVPGGLMLARYVPLRDGISRTFVDRNSNGELLFWHSLNAKVEPGVRMVTPEAGTTIRQAHKQAMRNHYGLTSLSEISLDEILARLRDVRIVDERLRELQMDGAQSTAGTILTLESAGLLLFGFYSDDGEDEVLNPPAIMLPADLSVGARWESSGTRGSNGTYALTGTVIQDGPVDTGTETLHDCRLVRRDWSMTRAGRPIPSWSVLSWICAGRGIVMDERLDADGQVDRRAVIARDDDLRQITRAERITIDDTDESTWQYEMIGRTQASRIRYRRGTFAPVFIPVNPPIVLGAAYAGDLIAFDASDSTGNVAWTYHTAGSIEGAPAVDDHAGRIYVGSTDKHVHALDARGIGLWSYRTGDNVRARPILYDTSVIVAGEDGFVYSLDAQTGKERWRMSTGAPVVSDPALIADDERGIVVVATDDGPIFGIDAQSGEARWSISLKGGVRAPLAVSADLIYVAGRAGVMLALDGWTGDLIWTLDMESQLSSAPVVSGPLIVIVGPGTRLYAIDRERGSIRWRSPGGHYRGPPAPTPDGFYATDDLGQITRWTHAGRVVARWEPPITTSETFASIGASLGGGALWLADNDGRVWRLGAPAVAERLPILWSDRTTEGRVDSSAWISSAPVVYHGQALVQLHSNHIGLFDAENGQRLGGKTSNVLEPSAHPDPVIVDDTALVAVGNILIRSALEDAAVQWEFHGAGSPEHPPVVADGLVLWTTVERTEAGFQGNLYAIDLNTGSERWRRRGFQSSSFGSGLAAGEGRLLLGGPLAALDLAGSVLWQSDSSLVHYGGLVMSASGERGYVAGVDLVNRKNYLLAVDMSSGREIWRADVGAGLRPQERPWLSGEIVIAPLFDGGIVALDAGSGLQRWSYTPAVRRLGSVSVDRDLVWFAVQSGSVLGLSVGSGELVARSSASEAILEYALSVNTDGVVRQRPAIIGHTLVAPLGTRLFGFALPASLTSGEGLASRD